MMIKTMIPRFASLETFFLVLLSCAPRVVQSANTLYVADNGMKASVDIFANMFAVDSGVQAAFTVWGGQFDASNAVGVVPGIPNHYLALNDIADIVENLDASCDSDDACQLAVLDYTSCDDITGLTVDTANHVDLDNLDALAYDVLIYETDSEGSISNAYVGQPAGAIKETADDGTYALYIAQDFKGNLNYYLRTTVDFKTTLVDKVAVVFGKDGTPQYCGTWEVAPQVISDNLQKEYFEAYEIACSKANSDSIDRFECSSWEAVNSDDDGDDPTSDGAPKGTGVSSMKAVWASILMYGLFA